MRAALYAASFAFASVSIFVLASATGCGGGARNLGDNAGDDASAGNTGPGFDDTDAGKQACVNLQCQQQQCSSGGTTTVSGKVYDPAGKNPLYNVIVYVPNADLEPFSQGASCDRCGAVQSGSPVVTTLTDSHGAFKLENVPVGKDIPLVMQIGKWRRQITIPQVKACQDNALTDPDLTRLPKNHSEGDMPQMAITTGGCDPLACLFRKIGIDENEFTSDTGSGKMHVYTGTGGDGATGSKNASALWGNPSSLSRYDMVILSCECDEHRETKPQTALDAMHQYAMNGGRIFATHYHYYWFSGGPSDFQSTASWTPNGFGGGGSSYSIDTSFPKGQAFADWLVNVGASTSKGSIDLQEVADDVGSTKAGAQRWIYSGSSSSAQTKYLTFNTPVSAPEDQQCGRVVFSDLHVSAGSETGSPVPSGCSASDLTPQEKALEFLFFDLSSCVQPDSKPPTPPVR